VLFLILPDGCISAVTVSGIKMNAIEYTRNATQFRIQKQPMNKGLETANTIRSLRTNARKTNAKAVKARSDSTQQKSIDIVILWRMYLMGGTAAKNVSYVFFLYCIY